MNKEEIKLVIKTDKDSVLEYFYSLPDDIKQTILQQIVFSDLLGLIENQLKHKTDFDSWSTSGWVDSSLLREELIKIQGLENEAIKDLQAKVRSLTFDVNSKTRYYDWYFKVYHHEGLHELVSKTIGWI